MHNDKKFRARILVAEDDHINLDIASRTLQKLGCDVVAADNGAIATLLIALDEFDMILMDCEMPQIDGIEATTWVRKMELFRAAQCHEKVPRRIPIIAVTAHSSDEVREKCLAAGMDDFVSKPLTRGQLALMLQRWIGEQNGRPGGITSEDTAAHIPCAQPDGPVDTRVLTALCNSQDRDGASYLLQLLARFEQIACSQLATLWEKYRGGQHDDVWRIAHTLKSSAGALGAGKLASQAGHVENHVKEHGLVGLEPALSVLETDVGEAISALSKFAKEFHAAA